MTGDRKFYGGSDASAASSKPISRLRTPVHPRPPPRNRPMRSAGAVRRTDRIGGPERSSLCQINHKVSLWWDANRPYGNISVYGSAVPPSRPVSIEKMGDQFSGFAVTLNEFFFPNKFNRRPVNRRRSGASAFRLSTNVVSMTPRGSCFSSESALGPSQYGIRERDRII